MTYLSINPTRLRWLLSFGLDPLEHREFFKKSEKQLISAGAVLHRLSNRPEDRLDFLTRLGGKPSQVFAKWLRKKLDVEEEILPEALAAQFKAMESGPIRDISKTTHAHARLGLHYLFKESPPEVWIEFLRSPLPGVQPENVDEDESAEAPSGSSDRDVETDILPDEDDVRAIAAVCDGRLISRRPTTSVWAATCGAIIKLRRHPELNMDELLVDISHAETRERVRGTLNELKAGWHRSGPEARGLTYLDPAPISGLGEIDADGLQILGRCTAESPTGRAAFVDPHAVFIGGKLWELDQDSSQELFPETGQVIGFPGPVYPKVGELSIWFVERFQSTQQIKLRIRARGTAAFTVVDIPASSSEPDVVREALKTVSSPGASAFLFRLSDGMLVKAPGECHDYLHLNYDVPLSAWRSLSAWRVARERVVLGPLPPPDLLLDCSDLATVLKQLLEDDDARRSWPALSHSDVSTIVTLVRSRRGSLSEQRLKRLIAELEAFVSRKEGLNDIVAMVLKSATVSAEVETAKEKILEDYQAARSDLLQSKHALEDELKQLNIARSRIQDENKRTAKEVTAAIRKAFEKAQSQGLKTLAELAVFEALVVSREPRSASINMGHNTPTLVPISVETLPSHTKDLAEVFAANGFNAIEARGLGRLVLSALATGMTVGIAGCSASLLVGQLAPAVAKKKCAIVDVGIGLCHAREMTTVLESIDPDTDVLAIRGANCSDFTVYGRSIETIVFDRLSGAGANPLPWLLLSFADGPSSLPIPNFLRETCLIIDAAWIGQPDLDNDGITLMLEERLENRYRGGISKLKHEAISKVFRECQLAGAVGQAWAQVLLGNIEDQLALEPIADSIPSEANNWLAT